MRERAYIHLKFAWTGLHRWPNAQGRHAYLANLHRHKFFGEACIEVTHDDRELEFFEVLDFINGILPRVVNGRADSCETYARIIGTRLRAQYGEDRYISVKVLEDNENGGEVEWNPRTMSAPGSEL